MQHSAYFQLMLFINFMLPVLEKLYKYAEQQDDKNSYLRNCKVRETIESTWDEDKSWWLS